MKFTPGPWSLNTQYADIEVRGPAESGVLIAVMSPWGVASDLPSPQIANARLIAAAPELLKVAQDFSESLSELGMLCECGESDCRTTRLRAAIAKATGAAA